MEVSRLNPSTVVNAGFGWLQVEQIHFVVGSKVSYPALWVQPFDANRALRAVLKFERYGTSAYEYCCHPSPHVYG